MFAAGGSAEAAKVGNAESEQFLPPSPLTRPAAPALPRYAIWQQGLRFLSTQQAVPGADRVLVPHGSRATGDGQTPPKDLAPTSSAMHPRAVCRVALVVGLTSGSAVFTSNPWQDRWSLPGGPVPKSGGCSRPRLAGTIAGSRVSGRLRRWLLFSRALPLPPATRAREPRSCPLG